MDRFSKVIGKLRNIISLDYNERIMSEKAKIRKLISNIPMQKE